MRTTCEALGHGLSGFSRIRSRPALGFASPPTRSNERPARTGDGPRVVPGVRATRSAAPSRSILDQVVVAATAVQDVLPRPADQEVVAIAAEERVVAIAA